jgi:hypothetical protein
MSNSEPGPRDRAPLEYYHELPEARDAAADAARRHMDEPAPPLSGVWLRGHSLLLWSVRLLLLTLLAVVLYAVARLLLSVGSPA